VRPRLLDLFAGAGGCTEGFRRAGFEVVGVDIEPHSDYPGELIVADALDVLADIAFLRQFRVVAASPPCPRYSTITPAATRDQHPDLIGPVRDLLRAGGGVYVIENVPGAPLDHPVMLCGRAFGLRVRRHRLFESNVFLMSPGCACDATPPIGVYGDHPEDSHFLRPNGTERGRRAQTLAEAQTAMGIDWMTNWDDLTDAIPPAYTEHIGGQLIDALKTTEAS